MERIEIKSPVAGGRTFKAWRVDEFFAVAKLGKFWNVFHIQTGMRLGNPEITSRAEAARRASKIIPMTLAEEPGQDWSLSTYAGLRDQRRADFTRVCRVASDVVYGKV